MPVGEEDNNRPGTHPKVSPQYLPDSVMVRRQVQYLGVEAVCAETFSPLSGDGGADAEQPAAHAAQEREPPIKVKMSDGTWQTIVATCTSFPCL